MALVKQPVPINFAQGLDTKTDPYQVQAGKFLGLNNSVFDTAGRLTKRNGFANITNLPDALQTTLTTLNDNLLATGANLYAYSPDLNQWANRGKIQPVSLKTQSILRNSTSQASADTAVTAEGLALVTYMDAGQGYYQISDSTTGQVIVGRRTLPTGAKDPRAYILGRYFVITFLITITAAAHLQYIAIPIVSPNSPLAAADISSQVASDTSGYDGVVANNNLYLAWGSTSTNVRVAFLTSTLVVSSAAVISSSVSQFMSVAADTSASTAVVYVTYYNGSTNTTKTASFDQNLTPILAPVTVISSTVLARITSIAKAGVLQVFAEVSNVYGYSGGTQTNYLQTVSVTNGSVGSATTVVRGVGLASKPFYDQTTTFLTVAFGDVGNQPTYFLIDAAGFVYMRLAATNGGGYAAGQVVPSVSYIEGQHILPYLFKDFLTTVNKETNSGLPANAIYTQTGINFAYFNINTEGQYSAEIAGALHLTGGQLWEYDGVKPVEHGFQVYPENTAFTTVTTGGNIKKQLYYYSFVYEWTDNQGNLHRSAPSIPLKVDLTGAATDTSTNSLYVPTLRLTDKVGSNPVRIVGYRWSVGQQVYYQFTSLTAPTLNSVTVDYVTITDTLADSSILGNTLLYTTGGVVENIAAPASTHATLFKNRLWLIDAEDQNLLWYSKLVIESTPVEMSDLFTVYVAPTSGAQGSTGPAKALAPMDDKLIIFKQDAIYYLTGTGPDATGANNDFTDPVYITASVGCSNPKSIVLTPMGIMFQSDKGIWLLGRDLSTSYIGDAVEAYTDVSQVKSAQSIPATNQIRFVLDSSTTLVYDYYMKQWGTFSNVNAISATLYMGKQTYLNKSGQVFQEKPGTYVDGAKPVLMSFTTSWLNMAGLQGYERFYFLFLLGTYKTPFKLNVSLAYDYNESATQNIAVTPDNYTPAWGQDPTWGSTSPWGGQGKVFEARCFPQVQKCESFRVTVEELYDPSFGVPAGEGLSLSGMNVVIGAKKGFRTSTAKRSFG